MRIRMLILLACSLIALGFVGCKDEGAEGEEATTESAEGADEAPAEGAEGDKPGEGAEGAEGDKPAEGAEGDKPAEGAEGAEAGDKGEAKSELTEEQCKSACEHATKLSMSAMPENATEDMKAAIEKVLTEGCPANCVKAGTKAQVDCYLAAKTAMDLAACPK